MTFLLDSKSCATTKEIVPIDDRFRLGIYCLVCDSRQTWSRNDKWFADMTIWGIVFQRHTQNSKVSMFTLVKIAWHSDMVFDRQRERRKENKKRERVGILLLQLFVGNFNYQWLECKEKSSLISCRTRGKRWTVQSSHIRNDFLIFKIHIREIVIQFGLTLPGASHTHKQTVVNCIWNTWKYFENANDIIRQSMHWSWWEHFFRLSPSNRIEVEKEKACCRFSMQQWLVVFTVHYRNWHVSTAKMYANSLMSSRATWIQFN